MLKSVLGFGQPLTKQFNIGRIVRDPLYPNTWMVRRERESDSFPLPPQNTLQVSFNLSFIQENLNIFAVLANSEVAAQ